MGPHRVEVIDEDLGRSGGGQASRPGFERLVSAVCLEEVGAVFAVGGNFWGCGKKRKAVTPFG
jgi:hypothetical protein